MDEVDTLVLAREAIEEGALTMGDLSVTDKTLATAQAGLAPFSFDVHVRLGMEVRHTRRHSARSFPWVLRPPLSVEALPVVPYPPHSCWLSAGRRRI